MELVSGQYFSTLEIQLPSAARLRRTTTGPAATRSRCWASATGTILGGEPEVMNQRILVNGQPFTIVGIVPRGFDGTTGAGPGRLRADVLQAASDAERDGTDKAEDYWIYPVGRLKPGQTRQQGEAALNATYAGRVEQHAQTTKTSRTSCTPDMGNRG
jgi:hypothetical protein